jgi:ACS family glucarate transporter-like MFS transporter
MGSDPSIRVAVSLVRPTRVRYQVLAWACALALVSYIFRLSFAALAPELKTLLSLNDQQLGYLLAAFLISYGGFEVPWGVLGDRFGVRHVLPAVAVSSSLLTAAVALVVWFPADATLALAFLIVVRFLFGLVQAGLFPPISRMMADWMPLQERGTAQGIVWMTSRIGGAVAGPVLAWLTVRLGGWPAAVCAIAGLGLVWAAGFWPWFHNRPAEMKQVNAAELARIAGGRVAPPPAQQHVPWSAILSSRSIWALCLMYGFGGFAANFFVSFLPTYLHDHRHLDKEQTAWLGSLPLACGIVACMLGGLLSDLFIRVTGDRKWGRRLSGLLGLSVAGVAVLSTIWVQDVWALGFLLCLTFFCNDLAMGPAWAACADIGERFAGTVGGKMNMIGNLAGAAGILVTGYLLHAGQLTLLFVVFACSFGLGALCWLAVDVTKPLVTRR